MLAAADDGGVIHAAAAADLAHLRGEGACEGGVGDCCCEAGNCL